MAKDRFLNRIRGRSAKGMDGGWREVRVFISSTFKDMQAERDHLVRFVFPRLRAELLERRIHFVDVDLRWGVTSDQDALELCLEEIDRCQPWFLCILGGRYGWVAPPDTVPGEAMARALALRGPAEQREAGLLDALNETYSLDADSGLYRLRERPRSSGQAVTWGEQVQLVVAMLQELGLAAVERSITASEVHYGALDRLDRPGLRLFYFRDPAVTAAIPEARAGDFREKPGSFAEGALCTLKAEVAGAPVPVYEYRCRWDSELARIVDLRDFGERVYRDLRASIDASFGAEPPEDADPFAEENAALDAFVATRLRSFVVGSRRATLDALGRYVHPGDAAGALCVVGEPGSGKSALLARFYRDQLDAGAGSSGDVLVGHFVGANASNVRELLRRLCREVAAGAGVQTEVPADYDGLRRAFAELLAEAATARPVILLIDAVDQLDRTHGAHDMTWIPGQLPDNVRIIFTAQPGPALEALRRRGPIIEVALGPLTETDATAMVDGFLLRYRKILDREQLAALLAKEDARRPLYLLVALEELRTQATYEEMTDRIRELPGTVQPLFDWVLARLESDPGFRGGRTRQEGRELVERFCTYLSLGRRGMTEAELRDLVVPGNEARNIPADREGHVAALQALLRPYLMRRGEMLDFYHAQARAAARRRYLTDEAKHRDAHRTIASYFAAGIDPAGDGSFAADSARGLGELPYHLTEAGEWQELQDVLANFRFMERKAAELGVVETTDAEGPVAKLHTGVLLLRDDFEAARDAAPPSEFLETLGRTLARESLNLIRRPGLLWQQLHNRLQWYRSFAEPLEAERARRTAPGSGAWLRSRAPLRESQALERVLAGHSGPVNACAISPDGSFVVSAAGDVIRTVGHETDYSVRVWNVADGTERLVLRGHAWPVTGCAVSPDGTSVLSVSQEGLFVWDPTTGQLKARLEAPGFACAMSPDGSFVVVASFGLVILDFPSGRDRPSPDTVELLHGCAVSPDGSFVVSAGSDGHLMVWDAATGRELAALGSPGARLGDFNACAVSPDGSRIAAAGAHGCLRMWGTDFREEATLEGHGDDVTDCAFSPDGSFLASSSWDGTVKIWDVATGTERATLLGHADWIDACAVGPDGTSIVSAGHDSTVRIWNVAAATGAQEPEAHSGRIVACQFAAAGSFFVTGSTDGTVRLWDTAAGRVRATVAGDYVTNCAASADGSVVVSGQLDGSLNLWESAGGRARVRLSHYSEDSDLPASTTSIRACAANPDGSLVASASYMTLQVWDGRDGRELATLKHSAVIDTCGFAPNGSSVVFGSPNGVWVWDPSSGEMRAAFGESRQSPVNDWALSPDADFLAVAFTDHTVVVFDVATKRERGVLRGHEGWVKRCAISPDGTFIVSASVDGTVRIWDVATATERSTLEGRVDEVGALAVSSDASLIASAGRDDLSLVIWDAASGERAATLPTAGKVLHAAFHPFEAAAVCGDSGGGVHLFDLVGVRHGPTVVTAIGSDSGPVVTCPACGSCFAIGARRLGEEVACPAQACGCELRVNRSVSVPWPY